MKRFILFLICLVVAWFTPMLVFGQQAVTVVDQYGNVNTYSVRTFDTTPKVIPIRPYGLNLKPAAIPERVNPYIPPPPAAPNPGPLVIENPYFPEREQENTEKLETVWALIGELFCRLSGGE